MSDRLTREFRAQLTTTMDSVLRRTMFEIMKIFENSLHDHQMELAQKGEEIAQLKIKLQRTEIKLKESVCEGDGGAAGQTSDVPEIDFEVPDDWCAPLGCETVTKQEDSVCPSVRLRQLYIPLWHVPIIKQEVDNHAIESHQQTKGGVRTRRGSLLKEKHNHTHDRKSSISNQATRCPPARNNMKKLLQGIKEQCIDLTGRPTGLGKGKSTGKEQENTVKSKREERKTTATESKSTEQEMVENDGEKRYSCKFCHKDFDTLFGRKVHMRTHKRCRGCKKKFPFPSTLKSHKPYCAKLQKLLAMDTQPTDPPKPQSCDEEKPAASSKKQVIIKKENTPSSSSLSESSKKDESTKKHSCLHCNKKFGTRMRMEEHMRIHTGENPFPCSMCPKTFRINQALKVHITRAHKNQVDSSETNGGLSWTMPLELIEDNQEDLVSSSNPVQQSTTTKSSNPPQQSPAIHHNKVQKKPNSDRKRAPRWQTMGTRCANGFICLMCQKLTKSKQALIEHFCGHTGEKSHKCDLCSAKFRNSGQLGVHKKKCSKLMIQCEKCEKKFPTQTLYDKHVYRYHKNWSRFCKVCGKGFFLEGRLRNHMEHHK